MPRQKRERALSIKWKIFAFLLGFCLLLLLILWLFQTVFLDVFYTSIKMSGVQRQAQSLAQQLEDEGEAALQRYTGTGEELLVELVNEQGISTSYSGGWLRGDLGPEQKRELFSQVRDNGGTLTLRHDSARPPRFGLPGGAEEDPFEGQQPPEYKPINESILCARMVLLPGGEQRMLLVSSVITPVNATVETLRVQLIWISAVMVILSVALALLISRKVAKPIEQLNEGAKELGKGHYEVEFAADGYREACELAGTLNQAARELSRTEELRRELIANVSHDLRTPLTLITGYAEMMRDLPGENSAENMQVIIDESKRLSGLVADLLDLSRIQSNTLELRCEAFDLTAETAGIIERFSKFSEQEGYRLRFERRGEVSVWADHTRLSQVIYNLLVNAMTHGGEDKSILVRQRVEKGRVRLEVVDTGGGIAPEDLPYIWDRYYKVDKVHKRAVAGTGLGLSIVKNILDGHPGVEYGVESQLGRGSSFWFSLPLLAMEK